MKKRLFLYTFLIIFTGLAGFFTASVYITHTNNFNIAKNSVTEIAQISANLYRLYDGEVDIDAFVQAGSDTRITIISPDGTVLADSRPSETVTTESHLNRPEIMAAVGDSSMVYVRRSETLGVDLIYYALRVEIEDDYVFIRVSIPVAQINEYFFSTLPLLVLILLILGLLCFVFIRKMANRVTKPFTSIERKLRSLSSGEYTLAPIEGSYYEIDKITHEIDEIAFVLQNSFDSLSDEKNKLDYILGNISDGIFTVCKNGNITLINNSALGIFGVTLDIIGKDIIYLSSDKALNETVRDCVLSKNNSILETVYNGKMFLVTVKRLPCTDLTMVVLSDVTENRENAKRREDFFANASHELKTPLTAIKGFNELTAINNKDENIRKYVDSITRETERMLVLIGDMLKLSELENSQSINPITISLIDVINDVQNTMSTAINEKAMSFTVTGNASIIAEQSHVYELVKNLVENAVRYGIKGGEVSVVIQTKKDVVRFVVSDNGIGIPPEEQARIFERFYRVEKSRSELSGGTGLGLSIVKHICALYNWKLSLKSKVGVGTEVMVEFGEF